MEPLSELYLPPGHKIALRVHTSDAPDPEVEKAVEEQAHTASAIVDAGVFEYKEPVGQTVAIDVH